MGCKHGFVSPSMCQDCADEKFDRALERSIERAPQLYSVDEVSSGLDDLGFRSALCEALPGDCYAVDDQVGFSVYEAGTRRLMALVMTPEGSLEVAEEIQRAGRWSRAALALAVASGLCGAVLGALVALVVT